MDVEQVTPEPISKGENLFVTKLRITECFENEGVSSGHFRSTLLRDRCKVVNEFTENS